MNILHFAFLVMFLCWLPLALAQELSLAENGCQSQCGGIKVPYPFGIGDNCFIEEWFEIVCDKNKPFLKFLDLEVLEISVTGTIRVLGPILYLGSCNQSTTGPFEVLQDTPFLFSQKLNRFYTVSCGYLVLMNQGSENIGGCVSICGPPDDLDRLDPTCNGVNCCQTAVPDNMVIFNVSLVDLSLPEVGTGICKYAFVAEKAWYDKNVTDVNILRDLIEVPAVLEWRLYNYTVQDFGLSESLTNNSASGCRNQTYIEPITLSYFVDALQCFCNSGYDGNPYLPYGCKDIDECADYSKNNCYQNGCTNTPGGYICTKRLTSEEMVNVKNKAVGKTVTAGICIGTIGLLSLLFATGWLYKAIKERKQLVLKHKFFKKNGGLLLQQQISSGEVNVEKIRMFYSKELEKATDNFNADRMLGQGGQGTVYKGMLADGRIVAVKKSILFDEGHIQQFINEVVILSQINHRNVVKLLGCCLETEVPLLVYEFIPNGTLSHYLGNKNEEFPLTWDKRLSVALEIAGALSYLHSAATLPIYHRDIKSTNILLDDKYRAKIADFGTSRSISIDQTHLTTMVQGTFGYLDPEYFQSSQFTEKSDVYSFGVVMVELLTGQKPICTSRKLESRSLVMHFIFSMEDNYLIDILDPQVKDKARNEEVMEVAKLARRCLNLNGRDRPTMKEVTMELQRIQYARNGVSNSKTRDNVHYALIDMFGPWDDSSFDTMPSVYDKV
ncbi:hypothetical protein ACFE04_022626 [Oxalis oulophora]